MARSAHQGAGEGARLLRAQDVGVSDMLAAAGYLFVCPENLAAMTGAMKEFFDVHYYPLLEKIEGRPYATAIAAGSDGSGATRQIDTIVTGWRLRRIAEPMIVNFHAQTAEEIMQRKELQVSDAKLCTELGQGFAEGLAMGAL